MKKLPDSDKLLQIARDTMLREADAIEKASGMIDDNFLEAVRIILEHNGKVVLTGIGKSGHIAQKIAATLSSTGTPSVFLHAADAVHGDMGIYSPGDPTILISKSGSTGELVRLIPLFRHFQSKLIAVVGNLNSPIAQDADVVLNASVESEADPLGVVPTTSTTVALTIGDALASALILARGFTEMDFARFHPAGQLGRNLVLHVEDIMHRENEIAWVVRESSLREVVIEMTEYPLGAACVVDENRNMVGLITDGDVRRALKHHEDIRTLTAQDIMSTRFTTILPSSAVKDAVQIMENRPTQISVLPVMEAGGKRCMGLVRIHDLYQSRVS